MPGFAQIESSHFDADIEVYVRDVVFDFESFPAKMYFTRMIQKILAGMNRIVIESYIR